MALQVQNSKCVSSEYFQQFLCRCPCFVLNTFYSQLHMNGIEQHNMTIQALSFLHIQGIQLGKNI